MAVISPCFEDHYHYGFNGQMKVNEIAGVGNHNTALFGESPPLLVFLTNGTREESDFKNISVS